MKILIDGDSCNAIKLIEKVAKVNLVPCHIYTDIGHEIHSDYSEVHIVDKGRDSADFAIVNACQPGDIVITNDGGLASMAKAKQALIMSPFGFQFTDKVISTMLQRRYMHARVSRTSKHNRNHKAIGYNNNIKREHTGELLQRLINESAKKFNSSKKPNKKG